LETKRKELESKSKELRDAEKNWGTAQVFLQNENRKALDSISTLNKKISALNKTIGTLQRDLGERDGKIAILGTNIKRLEEEIERLSRNGTKPTSAEIALRKKVNDLEIERDSIKDEKSKLTLRINNQNELINRYDYRLNELESETKDYIDVPEGKTFFIGQFYEFKEEEIIFFTMKGTGKQEDVKIDEKDAEKYKYKLYRLIKLVGFNNHRIKIRLQGVSDSDKGLARKRADVLLAYLLNDSYFRAKEEYFKIDTEKTDGYGSSNTRVGVSISIVDKSWFKN
jgi:chromosome segregation ATPase